MAATAWYLLTTIDGVGTTDTEGAQLLGADRGGGGGGGEPVVPTTGQIWPRGNP